MEGFNRILEHMPPAISKEMYLIPQNIIDNVEELRLRCGYPVILKTSSGEIIQSKKITREDLNSILSSLVKYSYYAYEEDLAQGFITINGGHRVGICGKAVINNDKPTLIREISSLNIRFAKDIVGCCIPMIPQLLKNNRPVNTLVISPPGCGKTTLLRDMARQLSLRNINVAICDDRSEIAGMHESKSSFNLGPRVDVLDGCDKSYGISILIRSMAPQVIITDEIGKKTDIPAIEQCLSAGVCLITSIHGSNMDDIMSSHIASIISRGVFKNLIFLTNEGGPGSIKEIKHC